MQTLGDNTLTNFKGNSLGNVSEIQSFLNFLADSSTSIPLNANFLISFEIPVEVTKVIATTYEAGPAQKWESIRGAAGKLAAVQGAGIGGERTACMFANGISLPVEKNNYERVGMLNAGLVSGVISTSREQQKSLDITFLETNLSFLDFIIRPWIIAGTHRGLIARSDAKTIKTNITAYFYDKNMNNKVRKQYDFYGCMPVSLDGATYATHDYGASLPTVGKVGWAYNSYTVSIPN